MGNLGNSVDGLDRSPELNAGLVSAAWRSGGKKEKAGRATTSLGIGRGSIPIARSINPVDAVGFTGFPSRNWRSKRRILDALGRAIQSDVAKWTRRKWDL